MIAKRTSLWSVLVIGLLGMWTASTALAQGGPGRHGRWHGPADFETPWAAQPTDAQEDQTDEAVPPRLRELMQQRQAELANQPGQNARQPRQQRMRMGRGGQQDQYTNQAPQQQDTFAPQRRQGRRGMQQGFGPQDQQAQRGRNMQQSFGPQSQQNRQDNRQGLGKFQNQQGLRGMKGQFGPQGQQNQRGMGRMQQPFGPQGQQNQRGMGVPNVLEPSNMLPPLWPTESFGRPDRSRF